MRNYMLQAWQQDDGVLAFEWVLLATILTIGLAVGMTAARDAVVDELGDVGQAMVSVDQSYLLDFPLAVGVHDGNSSGASDASFTDAAIYNDCSRVPDPDGQGSLVDNS